MHYPEYARYVAEGGLDHLKEPKRELDREQFARIVDMQQRFRERLAKTVGRKPEVMEKLRNLIPEGVLKDAGFQARVALERPRGCEPYQPAE